MASESESETVRSSSQEAPQDLKFSLMRIVTIQDLSFAFYQLTGVVGFVLEGILAGEITIFYRDVKNPEETKKVLSEFIPFGVKLELKQGNYYQIPRPLPTQLSGWQMIKTGFSPDLPLIIFELPC